MNFPPFLKEYSKESIINHVELLYGFVNNMFNDYVIPLSNELYSEYSRHKNAYALTQKTSKKTGTLDPSKIFAYKTFFADIVAFSMIIFLKEKLFYQKERIMVLY